MGGTRPARHPPPVVEQDETLSQPAGFADKVAFIWGVADLLRGDFKAHEYGQVTLPLVVLRRLECALEPTKAAVLAKAPSVEGSPGADAVLRATSKHRFYNTSPLDLGKILGDPGSAAANVGTYINGFAIAREVLGAYGLPERIARREKAGLLYQVLAKFADLDLTEDSVSNESMSPDFRVAAAALQRDEQRDRRGALLAARGHPADGEHPVRRGRRDARRREACPHALRLR